MMDNDLFKKGLAKRKATLGAEYVEASLNNADEFSRPFQEAMTAWCWGFGWGDESIDAKTRSMMNLTMIGALGKMTEWELHCRGAMGNGVSKEELRAIIHVIGIYCGVPQALECMRVARKVLEEKQGLRPRMHADPSWPLGLPRRLQPAQTACQLHGRRRSPRLWKPLRHQESDEPVRGRILHRGPSLPVPPVRHGQHVL